MKFATRILLFVCVTAPLALFAQDDITTKKIDIRDACDPGSFPKPLCGRTAADVAINGAITFAGFNAELNDEKSVGEWRFIPKPVISPEQGQLQLDITNKGGETHTFTRVQEFGGGRVPALNIASGNPVEAPECTQAVNIPAGTTATVALGDRESAKFQCCIHPWMRIEIKRDDDKKD